MDDYELAKALFKQPKDTKSARIVSGTAYGDSSDGSVQVDLDGSVITLQTNVPVKEGDTVQVTLSDRSPVVSGVVGWGDKVQAIAEEADSIATATNQHFWSDTNGIHVSTDDQNPAGTRNILINSLGILLRKAANTLVSISESAVAFFNGSGVQTATFGSSSAQIGQTTTPHTVIDGNGLTVYLNSSTEITRLGVGTVVDENGVSVPNRPYYTIGRRGSGNIGEMSIALGGGVVASAFCSHAEGYGTTASAQGSHAEGASSKASGEFSHAEGASSKASGNYSHAEGNSTASGGTSHAEGHGTASGGISHAEGNSTASGNYSHAQNYNTLASSKYQTAIGKYNVDDAADTYALIVGNGTADNARSNAMTVAWNGDLTAAGDVADGNGDTIASVKAALPKCDLIYDTPLYWWDSGAISGTDSGADDPSRAGMGYGELTDPITDYDFLVLTFRWGSTTALTNGRLSQTVPVANIEQWTSTAEIESGTKSYEFMYLFPAANPSYYIDVAYGFTDATHLYAKRRAYSNLRYWNIDKIYGVKL